MTEPARRGDGRPNLRASGSRASSKLTETRDATLTRCVSSFVRDAVDYESNTSQPYDTSARRCRVPAPNAASHVSTPSSSARFRPARRSVASLKFAASHSSLARNALSTASARPW